MDVETVATYDRIAERFAAQWWDTRLTAHMDRFRVAVGGSAVVVDLGCGPGRDTGWLAELGFASLGLDASFGMLAEARRRLPGSVPLAQADLVALPLRSDRCDGAWMCASLLHLTPAESATALRDVARVVRVGGALFVSVQAGHGMGTKSSSSGDRRFTFWSAGELESVVAAAGFSVDVVETAPPDAATGVSWIGLHAVRTSVVG